MKVQRIVVAALAALVLVLFVAVRMQERRAASWSGRAQVAEAMARHDRIRADSLAVVASQDSARADSLARIADERGRNVKSRVAAVRAVVVPDTCAPFVAQRDALINAQDSVITDWKRAYNAQLAANAALRGSNSILRTSEDSLLAVLKDRPHPRAPSRISLGVTAGACVPTGKLCVVAGVSWRAL